MKVEKTAFFRLKVLVDSYAADPQSFKGGSGWSFGMGGETERLISWFFYFQFHHFKFGEDWLTALGQDEEIRVFVIKELKAYQKQLEDLNTQIERNVTFLEK